MGGLIVASGALVLSFTGADEPVEPLTVNVIGATIIDGRLAAAISIENHSAVRQDLEITLSLGVFGASDAWTRRVAEVGAHASAIRSGETSLVVWDEPVAVPTGSYELTAWVDTGESNTGVIQRTATFTVTAHSEQVARVSPPDTNQPHFVDPDLTIEGGSFFRMSGFVQVEGTDRPPIVKVDLLVADPSTPWWAQPAATTYVFDNHDLNTGTTPIETLAAVTPGEYRIRIELIQTDKVHDVVLLPALVVIDPSPDGVRRNAAVAGPLAITNAQREEGAELIISVDVRNLSHEAVDGVFWWFLSAPGEPEPWRFADGTSFQIGRRFEPGEQRTVRLVLDGEANAGTGFEVSVWAHTDNPDDDETTHSDGVRLKELIDTFTTGDGA